MCGRYVLAHERKVLLVEFGAKLDPPLRHREYRANYNVAPSVQIPIIIANSGVKTLAQVRWGIVPKWSKSPASLLINARGESVAHKGTFASAFATSRILIPATGYYEWKRPAKDPHFISPPLGATRPMAMAGLVVQSEIHGQLVATCAIITLAAAPNLEAIHNRMPACIDPGDWDDWLDPSIDAPAAVELLVARSDLQSIRVDRGVNSVLNNSPALIEELAKSD